MKKDTICKLLTLIAVMCISPLVMAKFGLLSGKKLEYGAVYSVDGTNPVVVEKLGLDNLDADWGLWGHNVGRALPDKPIPEVFSLIKGVRNYEQFCFSSDELYSCLVKYILENVGEKKPTPFVIMPNDNKLACMCPACVSAGNKEGNATPAVTHMIERLAKRFPMHTFLTSWYMTTAHMPHHILPPNVGVIISAIDLPIKCGVSETRQGQMMERLLSQWSTKTQRIYIWDYDRNFDDYLTPYPCLCALKDRFAMYARHGVKGIIVNDSGYDYATFGDIQTYVISRLMCDPNTDVFQAIDTYCANNYPVSGELISSFYKKMEKRVLVSGAELPIYGGIDDAVRIYLEQDELERFDDQLDKVSKAITGEERKRLNYILTALNFTRIELGRRSGIRRDKAQRMEFLANLKGHDELLGMSNYREAYGSLNDYIDYLSIYDTFINDAENDMLYNKVPLSHSELDLGSKPINILTDGFLGIPTDYHTNWLICSQDVLSIKYDKLHKKAKTLHVGLLYASPFRIELPSLINVMQNGRIIATVRPSLISHESMKRIDQKIDISALDYTKPFILEVHKMGSKIALDEIVVE